MGDYEAAKAGAGNRVETFTRFLVAGRVLAARLGWIDLDMERSGRAIRRCCARIGPPDDQPLDLANAAPALIYELEGRGSIASVVRPARSDQGSGRGHSLWPS